MFSRLAALSFLLLLAGCPDPDAPPPPPPPHTQETFHEVVMLPGEGPLRTGFVLVSEADNQPGNPWSYFRHEDKTIGNFCYDLAVDPNGVNRYLSDVRRVDDNWFVFVHSGLGNGVWTEQPYSLAIPTLDTSFSSCVPTRIEHLTGDLFGIIWSGNGQMQTALFNSSANPAGSLVLGDTFDHDDFAANEDGDVMSVRNASLAFFNDEVRIVWPSPENDQINLVRGQVTPTSFTVETASLFFNHNFDRISDALATTDKFYVATSNDDGITLWERSTSLNWEPELTCPGRALDTGKLLYQDPDGNLITLASTPSFNSIRVNLNDCSTSTLILPARNGVISYHPGV